MAMPVTQIREWINSLRDDDEVGIDEDGLSLCVVSDPDIYLEVGGVPYEEVKEE